MRPKATFDTGRSRTCLHPRIESFYNGCPGTIRTYGGHINGVLPYQLGYRTILVGFARGIARSNPPNEGRAPILTLSAVKLWWTLRELNSYYLRARQESSR